MEPKSGQHWKHYGTGKIGFVTNTNVKMKEGGTRWVDAVAYYTVDEPDQIYVRSMRSFLQAFEKIGG
jgi:hypothetical protein